MNSVFSFFCMHPPACTAEKKSVGPKIAVFSNCPPKRGKIRPFLGRLIFFRPFMHAGGCMQKTKQNRVQLKKHRIFQENCRLRHRAPLTVRAIVRTFTYGKEEVDVSSFAAELVSEWLKRTASNREQNCFRFHRITERYVVHCWHVCHRTGFFCNDCADVITKPTRRSCCTLCETHGPMCIVCGLHASTAAVN